MDRQDIQPLFQDLVIVQASLLQAEGSSDSLALHLTWLEAHVVSEAAFSGGQSLHISGMSPPCQTSMRNLVFELARMLL